MRITRSALLTKTVTQETTPPTPPAAPRTRYGIRHADGRWLALAHQGGQIIPVWMDDSRKAWSWPFQMSAIAAVLDVCDALGPWSVECLPPEVSA